MVEQLKAEFLAMTGAKYTAIACKSDAISRFSCDQTPDDNLCKAQASVDKARTYFSEQLAEVIALQGDVVARSSADYKARLDTAAAALEGYTK